MHEVVVNVVEPQHKRDVTAIVGRVEPQVFLPEPDRDRCESHDGAGVTRVRPVDRIDREGSNRVDRLLFDLGRSTRLVHARHPNHRRRRSGSRFGSERAAAGSPARTSTHRLDHTAGVSDPTEHEKRSIRARGGVEVDLADPEQSFDR